MAYKRILVPIDGSPTSNAGLREALKLAREGGSALCVLNVIDEAPLFQAPPEAAIDYESVIKGLKDYGKKLLARCSAQAERQGVKAQTVLAESLGLRVADAILRNAKKWHPDLIVMGTHGRRGLTRAVLGSDAEVVVRNSSVPVLLIRAAGAARRKS